MSGPDGATFERPTRREVVKGGGTLALGGLLAGCLGNSSQESSEAGTGDRATDTEPSATGPATSDGTYSVTMEPVGTVEFETVPETIAPFTADYIDMLVALGHGDAVQSIWYRGRYKTLHYEELDGVSIDLNALTQLWSDGVSKEAFYEMDADLHLIDPHALTHWLKAWEQSDLTEVRENVAPFIGNLVFRRTDDWHNYRYYSLYEAFEKVAEMVQEQARFEAIRSIHAELAETVQARLPAPEERPNAALMFAGEEPEAFTPYRISGNGANKEHFQTLGIADAFSDTGIEGYSGSESLDYEALLEIDPDSLLLRYHREGKTREEFENSVLAHMKEHEVGSRLRAVQNDRVFRGGPIYTGPLHNLFMIERYAKRYFPETFTEAQLFDRERLARIITEGVAE
ncbi:ferrichrome-binding protein (plasmid) [Haloarcula hispanica N601]|uniref:Ferrichrome-binding protein n=2 Tax=Haloarcula hispanica TaxID=51589 RepID=V5TT74_HALHI|nr:MULTISPECIES: ABC transporter substrate-binding protein [Haloarcula]AEM59264.1 ferrichrome-binding protein [Haloarcula hispanica ATCC 33960]AHB68127.1 ferrichrome-binding protein [Haloarcula hispanica N601]KZX46657.1 Fe3+-hydroxamate ABC transporter substrate-binding protein [Haloarcula sp. K1]